MEQVICACCGGNPQDKIFMGEQLLCLPSESPLPQAVIYGGLRGFNVAEYIHWRGWVALWGGKTPQRLWGKLGWHYRDTMSAQNFPEHAIIGMAKLEDVVTASCDFGYWNSKKYPFFARFSHPVIPTEKVYTRGNNSPFYLNSDDTKAVLDSCGFEWLEWRRGE